MMSDTGHNFKFDIQHDVYLSEAFVALRKAGKTAAAELLCEVCSSSIEGRC